MVVTALLMAQGRAEEAERASKLARSRMAKHIEAIRTDSVLSLAELERQVDKVRECKRGVVGRAI